MRYFLIFSNCIQTKGKNRSIISDLANQQLYFIPNEVYDILLELKSTPLEKVKSKLDVESQEVLMQYIHYFTEEGIGFYCDEPKAFPEMSLEFHAPEIINNAIIDLDHTSIYDIKKVINELIDLRCKFLEVRAYEDISVSRIQECIDTVIMGYFRNVDFILKYPKNEETINLLKKMMLDHPVMGKITFHSSPGVHNNDFFEFTEKIITNNKFCGIISEKYFSPLLKTVSESQHHNTCLNQKIAIDIHGNIKNCPSMQQSFGNIKNTSLAAALQKKGFKNKWNINKDQIDICRDCEFRHICTDCRAYLENPEDLYSKPLKCGYNPDTNEWAEWGTNPLKQKAIAFYDMQDLIKTN